MNEITREYIAGILCAMQVTGDDEASAAIEKFIVKLEAENAELLGALEEIQEAFKCPYGNVNLRWIEGNVAEAIRKHKGVVL